MAAVAERRDLASPPPAGVDAPAELRALLAGFATEFADYAALIGDAGEAVRRNGQHLAAVVASAARQDELVRDTAAVVGSVSAEASQMAATVELLQHHVADAGAAGLEAGEALAQVSSALAALHLGLVESAEPLARIGASVGQLGGMLHGLGKLAGRAQLLAVNAAIEAAHIDGGGSRFDIVASEVRALAVSTRDAAADVKRIAVQLSAAAANVASATAASTAAAAATAADVARSETTLAQAQRSIAELETTVTAIGSASSEQSAALQTVAASAGEIAAHTAAAKRATTEAGNLALEELLRPAEERLRRWSTGSAPVRTSAPAQAHAFALSDPHHDAPYANELRELTTAVDADQRAVVADIVRLAVSVAYNGVAWRSIGGALAALRGEIDQVRRTVGESTLAARSASDAAASMRQVVGSLKARYDEAMSSLDRGLSAIAGVEAAVIDAAERVGAMAAAVERTNEIVALIDAVSDDTSLLSLNAAIESSRAGAAGRGFSVIAGEIRQLASATQQVTASVSAVVAQVARESAVVRAAIAGVAAGTDAVTSASGRVRGAVGTLEHALEETLRRALDVSAAADGQVRGLERVLENAGASAAALDADGAAQAEGRRIDLYALGDRAHRIAARRGVAPEAAAVRAFVDDVAQRVEAVFDDALGSRRLSPDALFELRYEELSGRRVGELARLFDVSRVPASGFDPPKYATPWDGLVDQQIIALLDDAFERAAFAKPLVISVTDLNGFMYAYPRRLIGAWTGVAERDRVGNRVKRLQEDEHGITMVRAGLGAAAASVGLRAPYAAFVRAGCSLDRPAGERSWLSSVFARDVNDVLNDLVMPVYARGRRHGAIRFGYAVDVL